MAPEDLKPGGDLMVMSPAGGKAGKLEPVQSKPKKKHNINSTLFGWFAGEGGKI